MSKIAYVSYPMTNLDETERAEMYFLAEKIVAPVLLSCGFTPYLPHIYGDPVKNAVLSPEQIDRIDRRGVCRSWLLVSFVTIPSGGGGIEIEMAYHAAVPVIEVQLAGSKVSRLVRGNPAVRDNEAYEYNNPEGLAALLKKVIETLRLEEQREGVLPEILRT